MRMAIVRMPTVVITICVIVTNVPQSEVRLVAIIQSVRKLSATLKRAADWLGTVRSTSAGTVRDSVKRNHILVIPDSRRKWDVVIRVVMSLAVAIVEAWAVLVIVTMANMMI